MKAFLDYIQEIKIRHDININIKFKLYTKELFIYFAKYDLLVLYKRDSYNIKYSKISESYHCISHRIFYILQNLNNHFLQITTMRFL